MYIRCHLTLYYYIHYIIILTWPNRTGIYITRLFTALQRYIYYICACNDLQALKNLDKKLCEKHLYFDWLCKLQNKTEIFRKEDEHGRSSDMVSIRAFDISGSTKD